MRITDSDAWEAGLEAGKALVQPCPHEEGSQEEWDWHMACLEGAAKRLGMRYSRIAAERTSRLIGVPLAPTVAAPVRELAMC